MNAETRLILEALDWIINNISSKNMQQGVFGLGIQERINLALNPPTNNLAEQRAEEIKDENNR